MEKRQPLTDEQLLEDLNLRAEGLPPKWGSGPIVSYSPEQLARFEQLAHDYDTRRKKNWNELINTLFAIPALGAALAVVIIVAKTFVPLFHGK